MGIVVVFKTIQTHNIYYLMTFAVESDTRLACSQIELGEKLRGEIQSAEPRIMYGDVIRTT